MILNPPHRHAAKVSQFLIKYCLSLELANSQDSIRIGKDVMIRHHLILVEGVIPEVDETLDILEMDLRDHVIAGPLQKLPVHHLGH